MRLRVALACALGTWLSFGAGDALAQPSLTIYAPGPIESENAGALAYDSAPADASPATAPVAAPPRGFAIVTERRTLQLERGVTAVTWGPVAVGLDPASVRVSSLTDPARTHVVEQRFRPGLTSPDGWLTSAVGQPITVVTDDGAISGVLRGSDPTHLIVQEAGGQVHLIRRGAGVRDIRLAAPPAVEGPALTWKVEAARAGAHDVQVSYRTDAVTWQADYAVTWDERAGSANVDAWVRIANDSGLDFEHAQVRLVTAPASAVQSQSWFESAVVPVAAPVSVHAGATTQVRLIAPAVGVRARRVLVHDSIPGYTYFPTGYPNLDMYAFNYQARASTADVYLELDGGVRGALPAGTVQLVRRAGPGEAALVARADIAHVAPGAPLRVRVGAAPNLEVAHSQAEFRLDERAKELREKVEVKLTNRGANTQDVIVREVMWRWTDWTVEAESSPGKRVGPLTREYRITVPAGKTRTLSYTAAYRW